MRAIKVTSSELQHDNRTRGMTIKVTSTARQQNKGYGSMGHAFSITPVPDDECTTLLLSTTSLGLPLVAVCRHSGSLMLSLSCQRLVCRLIVFALARPLRGLCGSVDTSPQSLLPSPNQGPNVNAVSTANGASALCHSKEEQLSCQ
jgi:hypothetical protein